MGEITWQAVYSDDTVLSQVGDDGSRHTYGDIDRARLVAFDLWRDGALLVRVDMRGDSNGEVGEKRLIWRMRNWLRGDGGHDRVHLVGWQRTVKGRNVQAICYVFDNGAVVLGGQFNERDPLMYSVVLTEAE